MSQQPTSIPKQRLLKPAEDYYRLRREGIGFIEQLGSRWWTDYNTHDPGITILEAFCFAITDFAYRVGWDIKDILAPAVPATDPLHPFPDQAFFTAREILSVNPWTSDDFRRLLIDQTLIRNAWLNCKTCACDVHYYAWCEDNVLKLAYAPPTKPGLLATKVAAHGLYEVLLELENEPDLGDLNDRKIEYNYTVALPNEKAHPVILELRFPEWSIGQPAQLQLFLTNEDAFAGLNNEKVEVKVIGFSATKNYNLLSDPFLTTDAARDTYLRNNWRQLFYVTFELTLQPSNQKIIIENTVLRIIGDNFTRNNTTIIGLIEKLEAQFIHRYRLKLLKVIEAVAQAKAQLHAHRNLSEDFCQIKGVNIEEVAVCADIVVAVDADIEKIQAQIWYEIETYFNPAIPFYSLQEMQDAGVPTETIFNGPKLDNGFIKPEDLEAAGLKATLRTSDIINRLMDLDGVLAVNNLLLTKYDSLGNAVKGASDPRWDKGKPIFDPNRISASWVLYVSPLHQPRLYFNSSKFLFYKNELPFLPRLDEAKATLTQLRGTNERLKRSGEANDLPIPLGVYRNPADYFPLQYSFPLTYGIGPEGLPAPVTDLRKAQARQLKAFLLFFEQILGNAFAQMAHVGELFSLKPSVEHTYFVKEFEEKLIKGYDELVDGLSIKELHKLVENDYTFLDRRNRFLDHLLARFGTEFTEYTLLLSSVQGVLKSKRKLIDDKIEFLKAFPAISHDRAKAFNYQVEPLALQNEPGIKKRINLFLGFPNLQFKWTFSAPSISYQLVDAFGNVWLEGDPGISEANEAAAQHKAYQKLISQMVKPNAYALDKPAATYFLVLMDTDKNIIGKHPKAFNDPGQALVPYEDLLTWSANERVIVVEHLLLRPKFFGDALYPACTEGDCGVCGAEDPYSFRLTFVMPGWTHPFNTNLDMRRFAEQSIRQEIPAHLLGKICWVANDGTTFNPCDPIVTDLANLLLKEGAVAGSNAQPSKEEACKCAETIYKALNDHFDAWYADKIMEVIKPADLKDRLGLEFDQLSWSFADCVIDLAPWKPQIKTMTIDHFAQIAAEGWQFERFEYVWRKWMQANSEIDWVEERLQDWVEAILATGMINDNKTKTPTSEDLCKCATSILQSYGASFAAWMQANLSNHLTLAQMGAFEPTGSDISLCTGWNIEPETAKDIADFLNKRYAKYIEVSYWLQRLLQQLGDLNSTFPAATLHDCDDGSDENPVRLGSTVLGSNALRRSAESILSLLPLYADLAKKSLPIQPNLEIASVKPPKARTVKSTVTKPKKEPIPKKDKPKRPPRKSS